MSGFSALNNARRAMSAQLKSMEVAGQNIANVNVAGYSRQVANHATVVLTGNVSANPQDDVLNLAGVTVSEVKRQYDSFLDARLRKLTADNKEVTTRYDNISRVEDLFNEPGDANIGTALDDLWTSFAQLTSNPLNEAARNEVLYRAQTTVESFHSMANEVTAIRDEVDERALRDVERINDLIENLADVNESLVATSATGVDLASPNALLDLRDGLLRELSEYVRADVVEIGNNAVRITVGGRTLLDGQYTAKAEFVKAADGSIGLVISGGRVTDAEVGGMLGGEIMAHNQDIPRYLNKLDELAQSVIEQVNYVQTHAYTPSGVLGDPIFSGSGALDIEISPALAGNPHGLAVSQDADGQDGKMAQRFADLRESSSTADPTVLSQYISLVSEIGSEARSLKTARDNTTSLVEYAQARSESVSGVSLDEELTDVVRYQQAYAAAARLLTSIDEMLDVLINGTGKVGR